MPRPDGTSARTKRVAFTKSSAERIARVVRKVEAGNRGAQPLRFEPRLGGGGGSSTFRLCEFTGAWSIGTLKTVTLAGSTSTLSVRNYYLGLNPESECEVLVAKDGTSWYLAQANLTKMANYDSSLLRVFSVAGGIANWEGVASCPTAQASAQALSFFQ